jgi:hypothetical protein
MLEDGQLVPCKPVHQPWGIHSRVVLDYWWSRPVRLYSGIKYYMSVLEHAQLVLADA